MIERPTRLAGRGAMPLALAMLLCCEGATVVKERASAQPPSAAARAEDPSPAVRVVEPPAISAFTPSLVARLRAIRASRDNRHDDVFMKVGDSSTVSRGFLECLSDEDEVDLAGRDELAPTLAYFRGGRAGARDPFRRESLAAAEGWSARHVLAGNPPPVLAELRAIRPRFALVMNGGNDVEGHDDHQYASRMLRIVEILSEQGVVSVLNSIPPRDDDPSANRWVARYNQMSWAVAHAMRLPYLDYHQVMVPLPRHGLAGDGVHPNIYPEGGRGHACRFDARGLRYGHNTRNLLALRGLDLLRRTVVEGEDAPDPEPPPLAGEGTVADPFVVRTLPFAQLRDTSRAGSSQLDAYAGCDATQDESGRELVYKLVVERPLTIRAAAVGRRDADADVHLLRGTPRGEACVARDDDEVVARLDPGVWFVVVDTFADGGDARAGEVLVLIAPTDGPT